MKITPSLTSALLAVAGALLGTAASVQAGSYSTDFNSGLPTNSAIFGNTVISTSGGYTNSACLQLTPAAKGKNGGFIITNDLDSGTAIVGFTARFQLLIGGGSGADGFSFNFAPDLPLNTISQEGAGTGLTVEFDTYPNGGSDTAPAIDVKVGGGEVAPSTFYHALRTGTFVDVLIQLNPDGTLSVAYDGTYIYSNLYLNGYVPAAGSLFGMGAATGDVYDNHWVDNLSITTQTNGAAYVTAFGPQGRSVSALGTIGFAPNSPIDIVLTNFVTDVNTNRIALTLDGVPVSPTITANGAGNTFVHYAPASSFAYSSTHSVSFVFADNAAPTPQTNTLQYSFLVEDPPFVPGAYVTVFSDDFESYVGGHTPLDKNYAAANAAPNGSGNPWFGPFPPNAYVVGQTGSVTPHSGANMLTGDSIPYDGDENWYNLPYRLRGGQVIKGNCRLDWWFYDPSGPGDTSMGDYVALGYYDTCPTNTDYPGAGNLNPPTQVQRISLGPSPNQSDNPGPGCLFDSGLYQARVAGGVFDYAYGWRNTLTPRSIGWHHMRIIVGSPLTDNTAPVYYYIDDMVNPTSVANLATTYGFNVIEINLQTLSETAFVDDVSFALAVPPSPAITKSANHATLTWPGSGWTLQSAPGVNGPWSDVANTSGYQYDTTSGPKQFFRLRN